MRKKQKKRCAAMEDYFYFIGAALLILLILYFFILCVLKQISPVKQIEIWKINLPPCPFHLLTGYYCPGCGGTRALRALLAGRVLRSFYYHPIVPYAAAVYLCFMATQTVERFSRHRIPIGMRYRNGYAWAAAVIAAVHFLIKNALHYYGFFK